ncbi:MAG: hypothetical protein WB661_12465 [Candidatus Bathyarchaeia archaeon]
MPPLSHSRPRTRQITLAASFAAVYFVLRSVPTFQMVGISSRFTAGDFLLTSIALLCGLWSGTLSVFIGTVLAYGVRPPVFFGLDFLPALVNVTVAALLLSGRYRIAQGIYGTVFLAFILSPYSLLFGFGYVPYTWLHIVALILLLSPIAPKTPRWVNSSGLQQIVAIGFLAFVGTMGQHLAGGLLYELAAGFVGGVSPSNFMEFWRIIFWLYPIERLLIVAFSMFIALAMKRSLRKWVP